MPNRFINQVAKSTNKLSIFNNDKLTNEQVAVYLFRIAESISDKIFIANLTKVGFPTLRVYIPFYSEYFYFENRQF